MSHVTTDSLWVETLIKLMWQVVIDTLFYATRVSLLHSVYDCLIIK